MKIRTCWTAMFIAIAVGALAGCSQSTKSVAVSDTIRTAFDQAGLQKVSVAQDRDKGVVTLGGQVGASADKERAEALANSIAAGQVVSNQIAVVPPGAEADAMTMNSDLDEGIEHNLSAALTQRKLHDSVKFSVKNHVVTLTGEVDSQSTRSVAGTVAASVPNVQQVVNELQIKKQKATSSD